MLLEINCSVEHFNTFLTRAEEAGVVPDFDMHGADLNSSFGLEGNHENTDISAEIESELQMEIDAEGQAVLENYGPIE